MKAQALRFSLWLVPLPPLLLPTWAAASASLQGWPPRRMAASAGVGPVSTPFFSPRQCEKRNRHLGGTSPNFAEAKGLAPTRSSRALSRLAPRVSTRNTRAGPCVLRPGREPACGAASCIRCRARGSPRPSAPSARLPNRLRHPVGGDLQAARVHAHPFAARSLEEVGEDFPRGHRPTGAPRQPATLRHPPASLEARHPSCRCPPRSARRRTPSASRLA